MRIYRTRTARSLERLLVCCKMYFNHFMCGLLALVFIAGFIFGGTDTTRCDALMERGKWLNEGFDSYPPSKWQPQGCMMRHFAVNNTRQCLSESEVDFVGDSSIRHIFWAVARKLEPTRALLAEQNHVTDSKKHQHTSFTVGSSKLIFMWDPYLNASRLDTPYADVNNTTVRSNQRAHFRLIGAPGLWNARHNGERYLADFAGQLNSSAYLSHLTTSRPTEHPHRQINGLSDILTLIAPISEPYYDLLSEKRRLSMSAPRIDDMQGLLRQHAVASDWNVLWSFLEMTRERREAFKEDGLHVADSITDTQANLLLNVWCITDSDAGALGQTSIGTRIPFDHSCCSRSYRSSRGRIWVLTCLFVVISAPSIWRSLSNERLLSLVSQEVEIAICTTFTALICCAITDRAILFDKVNKQFSLHQVLGACIVACITGVMSVRGIPESKIDRNSLSVASEHFLPRHQTEEWKGWMQVIILLYHYTGASKSLGFYQLARILVSAYLFMTGYGHALYFMRTEDFSLKRFSNVLLRNNTLTMLLPYFMGNSYMSYYFPPLVSIWFIFVYLSMQVLRTEWVKPLGARPSLIALNCLFLLEVNYCTPYLFRMLASILNVDWDAREFLFRFNLDRWCVVAGMQMAFMLQDTHDGQVGSSTTIHAMILHFKAPKARRMGQVVCIATLALYAVMLTFLNTKQDSNQITSYTAIVPIIAYVVLRNSTYYLRSHYSNFFAWFGRHSLETYILQYHLWLAADSHGVLQLPFASRRGSTLAITVLFLWGCSRVTHALDCLTKCIVDEGTIDEGVKLVDDETDDNILPESGLSDENITRWNFHGIRRSFTLAIWWQKGLRYRLLFIFLLLCTLNLF